MKNKLASIKTEELLAELTLRNKGDLPKDQLPHIGIVDDIGIDSLQEVTAASFGSAYNVLDLRARFNTHRHPVIFFAKMPKAMAKALANGFGNSDHAEAARQLKGLSTYKRIL